MEKSVSKPAQSVDAASGNSSAKPKLHPPKNTLAHLLILSIATTLVWSTAAGGEFVWIDDVEIEQAGYRITSGDDFRKVWTTSLDAYIERQYGELNVTGGYLRPIYATSISLDWWLWQDRPLYYHIENIIWHLGVVLGLYFLGLQLLAKHKAKRNLVFCATLLFAVHPFAMHSVTWISGRKDTLCAAFAILSLFAFGKLLHPQSRRSRDIFWLAISVISLNLALFSKELALVTPAFASVWYWLARDSRKPNSKALIGAGLLWASSLLAIAYRKIVLGGSGLSGEYPADSFFGNLATSARLVVYYIYRILIPLDPTIVDRWRVSDRVGLVEIVSVLAVLAFIAAAAYLLWKRKPAAIAICWFLIWLIPATGLVPLRHLYAERYLYPASWGLLLLLGLVVQSLVSRLPKQTRSYSAALVFLVCAAFTVQALLANQHWHSDSRLFHHAVSQNDKYVEGHSALARLNLDLKIYDKAIRHSEAAIDSVADPTYQSYFSPFVTHTNAGLAHFYSNNLNAAEKHFRQAALARPDNSISHYHLGLVCAAQQKPDAAAQAYRQAIGIDPEDHLSRINLGNIYLRSNEFEKCIEILKPTAAANPDSVLANSNIGSAYLAQKNYAQAEKHFAAIARVNPKDPINLAKLAWCQFEQAEVDPAKAEQAKINIERARKIAPNNPVIRSILGRYAISNPSKSNYP